MESTASAAGKLHSRKPAVSLVQNFQASSLGRRVALIQTHVVRLHLSQLDRKTLELRVLQFCRKLVLDGDISSF